MGGSGGRGVFLCERKDGREYAVLAFLLFFFKQKNDKYDTFSSFTYVPKVSRRENAPFLPPPLFLLVFTPFPFSLFPHILPMYLSSLCPEIPQFLATTKLVMVRTNNTKKEKLGSFTFCF